MKWATFCSIRWNIFKGPDLKVLFLWIIGLQTNFFFNYYLYSLERGKVSKFSWGKIAVFLVKKKARLQEFSENLTRTLGKPLTFPGPQLWSREHRDLFSPISGLFRLLGAQVAIYSYNHSCKGFEQPICKSQQRKAVQFPCAVEGHKNAKKPSDRPEGAQPAAESCVSGTARLHLHLATWWSDLATVFSLSNNICAIVGCLKFRLLLPWELWVKHLKNLVLHVYKWIH